MPVSVPCFSCKCSFFKFSGSNDSDFGFAVDVFLGKYFPFFEVDSYVAGVAKGLYIDLDDDPLVE